MKNYIKKNKYDVYYKILKIIDSCNTQNHIIATGKVIRNFLNLYGDFSLYNRLDFTLIMKSDVISYN